MITFGMPRKYAFGMPLTRKSGKMNRRFTAAATSPALPVTLALQSASAVQADETSGETSSATRTTGNGVEGVTEAADIESARLAAVLTGRRVEALSERTGDSTTQVNPNGSLTTDVASGTVRVKENGRWKRIDTTLVEPVADWRRRPPSRPWNCPTAEERTSPASPAASVPSAWTGARRWGSAHPGRHGRLPVGGTCRRASCHSTAARLHRVAHPQVASHRTRRAAPSGDADGTSPSAPAPTSSARSCGCTPPGPPAARPRARAWKPDASPRAGTPAPSRGALSPPPPPPEPRCPRPPTVTAPRAGRTPCAGTSPASPRHGPGRHPSRLRQGGGPREDRGRGERHGGPGPGRPGLPGHRLTGAPAARPGEPAAGFTSR